MRRVALVGATGLVGSFCLNFLLRSNEIDEVIVLTRRSLQQQHPKLKEYVIDFSKLDQLTIPQTPIESAFCCLGTTIKQAGSQEEFRKVDLEYVISFAQWSMRQGAKHFLTVSALGANEKSRFFYNRVKGEMESMLSKLGFSALDIFRPSLLIGPRKTPRLGEKVGEKILKGLNPILKGPLSDIRPTPAEAVAQAMVRCALHSKIKTGIHTHLPDEIRP